MPSESLLADAALVHAEVELGAELLMRYTGATTIESAECRSEDGGGWLHRLHFSDRPRSYDELSDALVAIEIHKKARCFVALLDDAGCTSGKIMLYPLQSGNLKVHTKGAWKRTWPPGPSELLIPGLERLSKELRVDFAIDVHSGGEGKRKREPIRTIYDEPTTAPPQQPPSKKKKKPTPSASSRQDHPIDSAAGGSVFAEKALDAIRRSHEEAMHAKDETIKALTSALVLKDELIRTQAALIGALQKS